MNPFVKLANYSGIPEAEMNAAFLRNAGIPVLVQGPQAGIFGAGFSGNLVEGATLLVAEEDLERAREILNLAAE